MVRSEVIVCLGLICTRWLRLRSYLKCELSTFRIDATIVYRNFEVTGTLDVDDDCPISAGSGLFWLALAVSGWFLAGSGYARTRPGLARRRPGHTRTRPGHAQDTPGHAQDTLGHAQDTPRTRPGHAQDTPRTHQDTPRLRPGHTRTRP